MRDTSHLTTPQVIETHYRSLLNDTSETQSAFVRKVREHYESTYTKGTVEWSQQKDPAISMTHDAEKFSRWLDNTIRARFPAEVLESTIAAFPAEKRFALQSDLAARQRMLAVPMPCVGATADGDNIGRMAKEAGEAISAAAELILDGVIDERDRPNAPHAIRQLREAQAVIQEMIERIELLALGKNKPTLTAVKK